MLVPFILLAQAADPAPCRYDRLTMLALPLATFDQDQEGGWRVLANRRCYREAADLILEWRERHPTVAKDSMLFWHEGQMRANAGQDTAAATLFGRSRKTPEQDRGLGWNLYVDGSVAFLRRDRPALDRARAALAALPRPANFDPKGPDGKPITIAWPMNLNVLDGLDRCWDQPYQKAYACAVPMRRVTVPGG